MGAHEQCPLGRTSTAWEQTVEGVAVQVGVATAAIAAGAAACDQPDLLEHVEMVGEEVGRDARERLELARGAVGPGQLLDDGEAGGIAERGVTLGSQRYRVHTWTI